MSLAITLQYLAITLQYLASILQYLASSDVPGQVPGHHLALLPHQPRGGEEGEHGRPLAHLEQCNGDSVTG